MNSSWVQCFQGPEDAKVWVELPGKVMSMETIISALSDDLMALAECTVKVKSTMAEMTHIGGIIVKETAKGLTESTDSPQFLPLLLRTRIARTTPEGSTYDPTETKTRRQRSFPSPRPAIPSAFAARYPSPWQESGRGARCLPCGNAGG